MSNLIIESILIINLVQRCHLLKILSFRVYNLSYQILYIVRKILMFKIKSAKNLPLITWKFFLLTWILKVEVIIRWLKIHHSLCVLEYHSFRFIVFAILSANLALFLQEICNSKRLLLLHESNDHYQTLNEYLL